MTTESNRKSGQSMPGRIAPLDQTAGGKANIDSKVVSDFGKEWKTFNQEKLAHKELSKAFDEYFHIFPFELLDEQSIGFDMGCGSGRWAKVLAPKVKMLTCLDPSEEALTQAKENLKIFPNCVFECGSVSKNSLADGSQHFGYCLGVLHHVPDTLSGLRDCVRKLRKGAPFLLYLYYRFDNKPPWFRTVWRVSDVGRRAISRWPFPIKLFASQVIAFSVYWPLAKLSLLLATFGMNGRNIPLSNYRDKSMYFMRTDALDRFGTKLEHRFTKQEILQMMIAAGLTDVRFSDRPPFWVAVGIKS